MNEVLKNKILNLGTDGRYPSVDELKSLLLDIASAPQDRIYIDLPSIPEDGADMTDILLPYVKNGTILDVVLRVDADKPISSESLILMPILSVDLTRELVFYLLSGEISSAIVVASE